MTSEWLPAVALGVGAAGTFAAQLIRERFTSGRERDARAAEREVARDTFQRETLLELQDAMLRVLQNAAQLHLHNGRVYSETGRYARDYYPTELSDESGDVMAIASRLRQRVLDDDLRQRIWDVLHLCTEMTRPTLATEADAVAKDRADAAFIRLASANAELEHHIGTVLRELL
jgi:hypothetical protein